MATYSLKLSTENCGKTAADGDNGYYGYSIKSCQRPIRWYHRRLPTTYRLATIPHDRHIQGHSRSM